MSFYRNAAGLLLTSAVGVPIGFATSILLARFLTPEERGLYALALTFALIVATLVRVGWPPASVYRIRRLGSDPAEVVATGVIFTLLSSSVAIAAGWLASPWIAEHVFSGVSPRIILLALCAVPGLILGVVMESISRGIDRFAIGNWYRVLILVSLLCAVVGVLVVGEGGVVDMLTAYVAVQTACALIVATAVVRATGLSFRAQGAELRKGLTFALKNYATTLSNKLHERIDVLLIAWLLGASEVAFYVIAVSIVDRLKILTESLAKAAYPQFAGLSEENAAEFACDVVRQSVLWVMTAALLLAPAASLLVPFLFGKPYAASVLPLLLLLPGLLGVTVYRVVFRYFMGIDRQSVNIAVQNTALVLNVLLNLLLIPRYGVAGAALASSVTYLLAAVMIVQAFTRRSSLGLVRLLVPTRGDLDAYVSRALRLMRRVLMTPDTSLGED